MSSIPLYLINQTSVAMLECGIGYRETLVGPWHNIEITSPVFAGPLLTYVGEYDSSRFSGGNTTSDWAICWLNDQYRWNWITTPLRAVLAAERGFVLICVVGNPETGEHQVRINQEGKTFGRATWKTFPVKDPDEPVGDVLRQLEKQLPAENVGPEE